MKFFTVVTARGGSKRLPHKNIMNFLGKPLIAHSIEYSLACDKITDTFMSTEDEEIKNISREYGAKIIDRPLELATDTATSLSVLQHAIEEIDKIYIGEGDYAIILLQPTQPLRPNNLIQKAIEIFEKENLESLFTVSRDTNKLGKIKNNKFEPFNYYFGQRSQDMEPLYYENGMLYIINQKVLMEGSIMNSNSYPLIVDHLYATVDIDELNDFHYGELVYNLINNKK